MMKGVGMAADGDSLATNLHSTAQMAISIRRSPPRILRNGWHPILNRRTEVDYDRGNIIN
jgi:hypothetical protein